MVMLKRLFRWVMLGCLTTALIVGCGVAANQSPTSDSSVSTDCRLIKHDAGEAEICGEPQTVVSLSAHALDLLLSLDQQPVGYVTPVSFYKGEIFDNPEQQIPYLGSAITTQPINLGNAQSPSMERLTALKPDLILGETRNVEEYKLLSQIAPTILLENRTVKGQWQEHLQTLAVALGKPEKTEALFQQYQTNVEQARLDLTEVTSAHPNLLLLGANRLDEGVYVIQPNTYLGELLEDIGFKLVAPPSPGDMPNAPVSLEALPELDTADAIIILGYSMDINDPDLKQSIALGDQSIEEIAEQHQVKAIQQSWQKNAIAQSLTASQENRVYFATYYKWNGLNGPMGTELVLAQLRQFFTE
ncbi:iron abc transporter substrate-binding protein [Leptolyngbya sp. Heron Island J]|uniref:ABC transporter substrate-binding protein n=1 Tax=Leptolyngbya sp. Heron Island J TaxID=1385935 RepID=UPI0003B9F2AD|nr:iron-siderophore ABC transporter substrate-binding protein [Leptolyngbya sp. Heron Island J]ESA33717.1 iron abc transporter substrate-binding protein [Leptolyngbya sp. Heron Island J]